VQGVENADAASVSSGVVSDDFHSYFDLVILQ
jgi:hypothetical protein